MRIDYSKCYQLSDNKLKNKIFLEDYLGGLVLDYDLKDYEDFKYIHFFDNKISKDLVDFVETVKVDDLDFDIAVKIDSKQTLEKLQKFVSYYDVEFIPLLLEVGACFVLETSTPNFNVGCVHSREYLENNNFCIIDYSEFSDNFLYINKTIDPKYIDVPNICFSLVDETDSRDKDFSKQRIEFGFDDSETWSLKNTIASFIIPRLERYIELYKENIMDRNGFGEKCEELLWSLQNYDDGESERVQKGLDNFPKIFHGLWW